MVNYMAVFNYNMYYAAQKIDFWWLHNIYNSWNATFASISATMENVALAITDSARADQYPIVIHVYGIVWESTICTEFDWP